MPPKCAFCEQKSAHREKAHLDSCITCATLYATKFWCLHSLVNLIFLVDYHYLYNFVKIISDLYNYID